MNIGGFTAGVALGVCAVVSLTKTARSPSFIAKLLHVLAGLVLMCGAAGALWEAFK